MKYFCNKKRHISLYKSKESLSVSVCVCLSNISAAQDRTDLRLTTWLLCISRMCNFAFFWTAMTPVINYFINALQIRSIVRATSVTCAPEPITAEPTATPQLKKQSYTCSYVSWTGILSVVQSRSVLFGASKLTVVY